MKVFIVCRLMSGFVDSISSNVWNPKGGPAIAKVINRIDRDSESQLSIMMTRSLSPDSVRLAALNGRHTVEGLNTSIDVRVPTASRFVPSRLMFYVCEFVLACAVIVNVLREKPDVIYVDRSNFLSAALLARVTKIPVFLRLLGVPPDLVGIGERKSIFHALLKWCFRSPFAYVLCTRDGSPARSWMQCYLGKDVKRVSLLNGVDFPSATTEVSEDNSKILRVVFVSRLEEIKGAQFFIDAMMEIPDSKMHLVEPVVVGYGSLFDRLKGVVNQAGRGDWIRFTGGIPANEVQRELVAADLCVSLNRQGHISNSNLEAVACGLPIVLQCIELSDDRLGGIEDILEPDCYVAIDASSEPSILAEEIVGLASDRPKIEEMKASVRRARDEKLQNWERSIEQEFGLLCNLAGRGSDTSSEQADCF